MDLSRDMISENQDPHLWRQRYVGVIQKSGVLMNPLDYLLLGTMLVFAVTLYIYR